MDAMWLLVVAPVLAAILVVIATSVGIACFRVLKQFGDEGGSVND